MSNEPILDIAAIEALLPHRYPFLLVDKVVEIEPLKRIVGVKSVTFNEQFFQGHFPGHPVMPGVLVVEALAQCSALLALHSMTPEERQGKVTYFMAIDGARFRRPVVPGDRLELHCDLVKIKASVFKFRGEARVDGHLVAEAELMAMMADKGAR